MKELLIEGFLIFFRIYFEKCPKGKMIESTLEPRENGKRKSTGNWYSDRLSANAAKYTPLFLFSI